MGPPEIVGRHASHFTRLVLITARELDIEYTFTPIYNLMALDSDTYGSHPGLRMPTLRVDDDTLFGAVNICRHLANMVRRQHEIVWPNDLCDNAFLANVHELTMQAMASQVTIVIATQIAHVDPSNPFTKKLLAGLAGTLGWLDTRLDEFFSRLPSDRLFSITEAALFCLTEHIKYRKTIAIDDYLSITQFAEQFGARRSAIETFYHPDE
jgi:glutathione S-transferase